MKNIVLISHLKSKFGPISKSLMMAAPKVGASVGFIGDDVSKYDNVLVFVNDIKMLPKTDKNMGWWMCDLRKPEQIGTTDSELSKIFLCNTEYIDDYAEKFGCDVEYMPQCGDSAPIETGPDIKHDVVFIGNLLNRRYHANRGDIIKKIRKRYTVNIVSGESYTKDSLWLYNKTRISLAVSNPVEGYTSNRLYNILAAGGLCMTNYFPGIEHMFENHNHLVWFEDDKEMMDAIGYYLDHPEERNMVAESGNYLYRNMHTAEHRLTKMFNSLEKKYEKTN